MEKWITADMTAEELSAELFKMLEKYPENYFTEAELSGIVAVAIIELQNQKRAITQDRPDGPPHPPVRKNREGEIVKNGSKIIKILQQ
jgi:hypothetical protein